MPSYTVVLAIIFHASVRRVPRIRSFTRCPTGLRGGRGKEEWGKARISEGSVPRSRAVRQPVTRAVLRGRKMPCRSAFAGPCANANATLSTYARITGLRLWLASLVAVLVYAYSIGR
ncbi:hypothetical protein L226DRAFT_301423 [Lentinus tigrinus ALCF2SS1-7]|uniref:uncharacterized protein n=1 Tax=Lentinus tigrinus ALCF2SS1-7 TaxID=1328758 RepID=UPI001165F959|nr:hypothetical protein L226DRAFT_301423 [Lentinus tigrinus ALCF2SS1-7]